LESAEACAERPVLRFHDGGGTLDILVENREERFLLPEVVNVDFSSKKPQGVGESPENLR
jgi:hypothetical protein